MILFASQLDYNSNFYSMIFTKKFFGTRNVENLNYAFLCPRISSIAFNFDAFLRNKLLSSGGTNTMNTEAAHHCPCTIKTGFKAIQEFLHRKIVSFQIFEEILGCREA